MKKQFCTSLLICLSLALFSQKSTPVEDYYNFLKENQNMDFSNATSLFPLQNNYFQANPNLNALSHYKFFDSIDVKYNLTDYEKEMIAKNGFVVTQRLNDPNVLDALEEIYKNDLPVMITTDMMLYALHTSYDAILMQLEITQMRSNLIEILSNMKAAYPSLKEKYMNKPELNSSLRDIDLYISIPLALLGKTETAIDSINYEEFQTLIAHINAEDYVDMPLFCNHVRHLDFSQFEPRSHYTTLYYGEYGMTTLSDYFKAMIWLGGMDFLLSPPPAAGEEPWSNEDIRRMNISALLVDELLGLAGEWDKYNENDHIIELLVGSSDNLTPGGLANVSNAASINDASDLLDSAKFHDFKIKLMSSPESEQKILSDIFMVNPYTSTPDTLPVSFKLFGQRFIIDSYFFSQLVYDHIIYNGRKIKRLMPSTLDASFILGNNDALNLLKEELDSFHYATQLSCLRKLTESYDSAFWQQSFYNSWLSCIRGLNNKPSYEGMPFFLSTAAWQQEKINTQLASWSQLRHDNLLYAKQSYTAGIPICSYPYSYIEPYPQFYSTLSVLASKAKEFFSGINSSLSVQLYFTELQNVSNSLKSILDKQMNNQEFSSNDITFLKSMLYFNPNGGDCGGTWYPGWYYDLLFSDAKEQLVADVHTQPTDEEGGIVGNVLHVGTGKFNLGIFLANSPAPDSKVMTFVGPVMSYYETVTSNFNRYNDEEWDTIYPTLSRPDWTSIYLADNAGEALPKGRELPFSLVENTEAVPVIHPDNTKILIYPNPGNGKLNFANIPQHTDLIIYDLQGRIISQVGNIQNTLDLSCLPQGMYILKFKGKLQRISLSYIKQ